MTETEVLLAGITWLGECPTEAMEVAGLIHAHRMTKKFLYTMAKKAVTLTTKGRYVVLNNGIVQLTILKPQGFLTGIKYGGMDNLLDLKSDESSRGYWDLNWSWPGGGDIYRLIKGSEYSVIHMNNDNVEVSFRTTYSPSTSGTAPPFSFDTRFHYMAISDEKQRTMPMPGDLLPGKGKQLIVPESVLLVNPINPDLKGEVDDKYMYSMDNKDGGVHGWIGSGPIVGFWMIFPSQEFRNGGPTKQNLTVHTGPACLAMLQGTHYIGEDIIAQFEEGETWKKVFGPFFIYLNSTSSTSNAHNLWEDAKNQKSMEETSWPYNFVSSPYYLTAQERGSASGRLFVQDKFISSGLIPAKNAYVGLSAARTEDSDGNFTIRNVVPGVYGLHGWVPGFIGDYLEKNPVTISAGSETKLGDLIYVPIRDGPTVWEIGFPDRTAIDFYVPDVNPMYVNKLFIKGPEKYRQYGLWDRYTDIHPQSDQVFTVGVNDPKKDWFFVHVDRRGPEKYLPTTWTVGFTVNLVVGGTYKLRLALASATRSDLQRFLDEFLCHSVDPVRALEILEMALIHPEEASDSSHISLKPLDFQIHVNQMDSEHLVFQVLNLGTDNTVCRHGIHGLYRLFTVDIPSSLIQKGDNSIYLSQARGGDALCGILYDYLRLEAPST
ncbi:hypothetical protein CDL15_Pgr028982 [Punica granatum]|uniref:rhamnogalacturonan endolyase n=1 Tax=Punica granatum TaxID=22663 RepID=A0A218XLL2_PUNGR|nr:hypothetical protein CDL15_Pgr028982 [Punica granatum]